MCTYVIYAIRIRWPNGKKEAVYVGRTNNLWRRLAEHNKFEGWTPKLYNIISYAYRSGARFNIEPIERGCSEKWAKERERYWIARLKPRGNSTEGG